MKKLILSTIVMASLAFAAQAVTNMCVKTTDGKVVKYDVESVMEVYYEDTSEDPAEQGVTVSGIEGNYTYVDLGLESGTKWATYNVGATKPTECGDYFAWGEIKPKEKYGPDTYTWYNATADSVTKYCTNSEYGDIDNNVLLEDDDDAVTANWGAAWRMPTNKQQQELKESCDWKWVENFNGSGVSGQLGTSLANGATIFLPAAGQRDGEILYYVGQHGFYWSSEINDFSPSGAYYYRLDENGVYWGDYLGRENGNSVRAVLR